MSHTTRFPDRRKLSPGQRRNLLAQMLARLAACVPHRVSVEVRGGQAQVTACPPTVEVEIIHVEAPANNILTFPQVVGHSEAA